MESVHKGGILMIENLPYNVPSQVKNLFYGHLAPYSDYIIYTESRNNYNNAVYVMYEKNPWEKSYTKHIVTYNGSDYVYSSSDSDITDISVSLPYYAYASEPSLGVVEVLPSVYGVGLLCLIVLCGCAILKTVFGGVKVWRSRKSGV